MTGWPVGFLSYQIRTEREKEHTVKILFDVDTEWMFGKREVNSWVEQGWRFTKSDSLYLAMRTDETRFSYEDNHIILSQKLCSGKEDRGVLLIGYKEGQTLQYGGENLRPLWNNDGAKEVKELNIKQEIAEDRTIPIMLGQSATDLLLITDSQTNNVEHYGFEYSIISKEGYLNSDVAELRKVSFIEDGSNVS